jgi:signal transduction histidine kinase
MSRLHVRIWLHFAAIAVVAAVCAGLAARWFASPDRLPRGVENAVVAWFAEPDRIAEVATDNGVSLGLWTRDGLLVAGSPDPPAPEPGPPGWRWFRKGPGVQVMLPDGRVGVAALAEDAWQPARRRHGVLIVVSLAVLAFGTWPLARRLTARIEALQAVAARWEGGDLSARAEVRGHDEIASLARRFNAAATRVEALVASERRLRAAASHELRSPLTRIRMALELMDDGSEAARGAVRDVEDLDRLVGDMLAAARGASAGPAREPVDLDALVRDEAARAGATVEGLVGACAVDGALVRRLARNLLDNAGRHGAPPIVVTLRRDGDTVALRVADGGAGVPAEHRDRVFEPFWRPPGHREGDGGAGLGLALVREIARAHGGDARVIPERPSAVEATLNAPQVRM